MHLTLIETGGTICMTAGPNGLRPAPEKVAAALALIAPGLTLDHQKLDPLIDSADLGPAIWNALLDRIAAAPGPVIVTHGTDTMAFTGAALEAAGAGQGRAVEVSLFHTMADWMNVPHLQAAYGNAPPSRVGLQHPTIAPYGAFACADGRQVLLSVQSDREWAVMAERVLGQPDLARDPRYATNVARVAHRDEVEGMIAPVLAALDREGAVRLLQAAGIACGRISDLDDLQAHPQARHVTVDSPTGPVRMMARGVRD